MYEVESYTTTDNERVTIMYDDSGDHNPREWDNLGTMVCWHGRYNLGDEQPTISPSEYAEDLPDGTVTLPLYLYDHGGITMSVGAFSCPFDSGQVGFIYATPERVMECYLAAQDPERVIESLVAEVAEYDKYLQGEVYWYKVEKPVPCDHGDIHWEHVDSCGGYLGEDGINQIKAEWPEQELVTA